MSDPVRSSFSINLKFRKDPSRVVANSNFIFIEPLSSPESRTTIPLNQVISVRGCYCKNFSKRLLCKCISEVDIENGKGSPCPVSPPNQEILAVRVYYAVPVGKFRWKVTFVPLLSLRQEVIPSSSTSPLVPVETSPLNGPSIQGNQPSRELADWMINVSNLIQGFGRPKKLLLFINPFGGKRRAPSIFAKKVAPLLQVAGIQYNVVVTERANHAKETIEDPTFELGLYDGLIGVGGDGMASEILNGLLTRTQNEAGINHLSPNEQLVSPQLCLGVIPAGSTDATAFGVSGINDAVTSTVHIIFGKVVNIDIAGVYDSNDEGKLIRYATSFLGYGFLGDVMLDSERHRWMGPTRYDWAGLKKLMACKVYEGEIKLHISTTNGSPRDRDLCLSDCALCAEAALRSRSPEETEYVTGTGDGGDHHDANENRCFLPDEKSNPPPESVLIIRGKFLSLNAAIMPCRCLKAKKGMSPAAHLGNGCSDLIIVSECSRMEYIKYLLRIGSEGSQSPFDLPHVDVYRVNEFEFRPTAESAKSVFNVDGEIIHSSSIRVKIHCQLLPVFGVGRENRFSNNILGGGMIPSNRKIRDSQFMDPFKSPLHLHDGKIIKEDPSLSFSSHSSTTTQPPIQGP